VVSGVGTRRRRTVVCFPRTGRRLNSCSPLPFSLDPELQKIATPLFTSRDAVGVTQFIMFTARKPFIDKNRSALVDCLEDSLRILH
jgi:hypothetical protein